MRILYLGDIVGTKALDVVINNLNSIKKEYNINLVFANAENVADGKGLTRQQYVIMQRAGIQAISMGNHTYSKKTIFEFINESNIVKPANMSEAPGKSYLTIRYNDKTITLISLLGRVFLNMSLDCPFKTIDKLLKEIKSDYIIVDVHAEATSEKMALAYYLENRVSAVLGTHTHIQTADERKIGNTLYITDIGMCGPYNSVIGDDALSIINRFKTGIYTPTKLAEGPIIINGVILDLDMKKIWRLNKIYG